VHLPHPSRLLLAILLPVLLLAAACGDDDDATEATIGTEVPSGDAASEEDPRERPTVVATTSILGDVVANLAGDQVEVVTLMPVGADPHDFQASAREANQLRTADAVVANGADFEEGLLDLLASAESDGVAVHEAITPVAAIEYEDAHGDDDAHGEDDGHGHDDDDGHGHDDDDHSDDEDDGHGHEGDDPHFFTDPARMAVAVDGIADFLAAEVEGIDVEELRSTTEAYVAELEALDAEVEGLLADIADEDRVLVTNHEVFGYFADRYDFEVLGAVIPTGTTDGGSAADLARLASVVRDAGVPAIFADTSSPDRLAQTLAAEVGDVEVVELFSESLGPEGSGGETYVDMVRTNAQRIADALA
jgi:zinc/manganese transport system substrate-binding protein